MMLPCPQLSTYLNSYRSSFKCEEQEIAKVNINILGISELYGPEWVNLIQMIIISTTVGKNPLEEME